MFALLRVYSRLALTAFLCAGMLCSALSSPPISCSSLFRRIRGVQTPSPDQPRDQMNEHTHSTLKGPRGRTPFSSFLPLFFAGQVYPE
uniref:Putative secreted peptide n=1 Tax=Anopheles braziliensis TaxID=58242 RepID=A0A2M3ZVK9_9DIPT